jgi:hypothetical protein
LQELPKEITEGMTPILSKYGITTSRDQGECMVAIGRIFQRSDIDGLARKKYSIKDWTFKVSEKIMDLLLVEYNMPLEQRAECTKEIMSFVANLFKKVADGQSRR